MPGKKDFGNYMEWQGHKSYNTSCYIYKNIMLKKTGKTAIMSEKPRKFSGK